VQTTATTQTANTNNSTASNYKLTFDDEPIVFYGEDNEFAYKSEEGGY